MTTFKEFLNGAGMFYGKPGVVDPRLTNQVHKSTVAAGKAPRLELGVVGISIGQVQSTGDTSKSPSREGAPITRREMPKPFVVTTKKP